VPARIAASHTARQIIRSTELVLASLERVFTDMLNEKIAKESSGYALRREVRFAK